MRPDRVAVYSFALRAVDSRAQKHLTRMRSAAGPTRKLELFAEAMHAFLAAGYRQIGMDHFALPDDELARAVGPPDALHRNFMGYTMQPARRHGGRSASRPSATSAARSRRTSRS